MKKTLKILQNYIYQSKILLEEARRKNTNTSKNLCGKRGSEITYRREKLKRNLNSSEVTLTYNYCFLRSENMKCFLCVCFGFVQGGKS